MTFLSPPGIKGLIPTDFFDLRLISMAQIRRNKLDFKDTCKERKSLLRKMCQNTDFVRRICSCTRKYESEKALVQTNFVKWLTDSVITSNYCSGIVRKVSKYGVFSGQYLSVFSLNAGKNAWLCDCFVKFNQLTQYFFQALQAFNLKLCSI